MKNLKSYLCRDINGTVHIIEQSELVKRSSVYGIIRDDDTDAGVLFVKNQKAKKWDLPGGGIEKGESLTEALKREIKEETGLTISKEPKKLIEFTEYFYDLDSEKGWESTRTFFEVDWKGDPILSGNNEDIKAGKFLKTPLVRQNISPSALAVLRFQLINTHLRHVKLVAHTDNFQDREYQADFWSWEELVSIVEVDANLAMELVLELIDKATDEIEISYIAAGRLEDLLCLQGMKVIKQVEEYAKKSPRMAEALLSVWGLDKAKDKILVKRLERILKAAGKL